MSRSNKKAIVKDKGYMKELYWRVHRRVNKAVVKLFSISNWVEPTYYDFWEDYEGIGYAPCEDDVFLEDSLKQPKELVNDYDYSDYSFDFENKYNNEQDRIKYRRK